MEQRKGQIGSDVHLPADILELLQMQQGDAIWFDVRDGEVRLRKDKTIESLETDFLGLESHMFEENTDIYRGLSAFE